MLFAELQRLDHFCANDKTDMRIFGFAPEVVGGHLFKLQPAFLDVGREDWKPGCGLPTVA